MPVDRGHTPCKVRVLDGTTEVETKRRGEGVHGAWYRVIVYQALGSLYDIASCSRVIGIRVFVGVRKSP